MAKILCVGQMVADILVQNVNNVDFTVDTRRVDRILIKNGGDCLNTAIDLKQLGADVGIVGVLGKDMLGEYLNGIIVAKGIDDSGICFDSVSETSSVVVLINAAGERVFLYYGGSNDVFSFDKIKPDVVQGAKIVHVGGVFMLPKFDGAGAKALFTLAHQHGSLTTMDVTWDASGRWLDIIEPCLPELDLFMPSINEAKEITGLDCPEEISRFLKDKGVKNVIVKLGTQGCYVDAFGKQYYVSAFDVPVVDTTGAGDSFVAGVLYGLAEGWDIEETTRFASAVSAHCIQQLGATAGIPSSETILNFLSQRT